MQLLDITVEVGPAATPARLEALVRGIRVAVDVAREAEVRRIRRTIAEQMKFPTDSELREALNRLPSGDESSPRYRVERQLAARKRLREEVRHGPPDFWWFYLHGRESSEFDPVLRDAGYERLLFAAPTPFTSAQAGLDVLDPALYQALVSDVVARLIPEDIGVRQLRYENPFLEVLSGAGTAEKIIPGITRLIEAVVTWRSTLKKANAEAAVAQGTVEHRVEDSRLDVELKRVKLEREREALEADRIRNGRARQVVARSAMIDAVIRNGQLDAADVMRELDLSDAVALDALGLEQVEVEERYESDEGQQ